MPEEIIRRPKGFRPPTGVFVGKVTAYIPKRGGLIDHQIPFDANVVKAFGGGETSNFQRCKSCQSHAEKAHISFLFEHDVGIRASLRACAIKSFFCDWCVLNG